MMFVGVKKAGGVHIGSYERPHLLPVARIKSITHDGKRFLIYSVDGDLYEPLDPDGFRHWLTMTSVTGVGWVEFAEAIRHSRRATLAAGDAGRAIALSGDKRVNLE